MTILNVHIIYIAFMYIYKKVETKIIVCTPPPFLLEGRGGVNLQPNFQKGGLYRTSTFRGGLLGKTMATFFRRMCNSCAKMN